MSLLLNHIREAELFQLDLLYQLIGCALVLRYVIQQILAPRL